MKWFKHMSDMAEDVRIKRVIRKYNIEGYGLYNYILERIVKKLETDSPEPILEESAQDIAADLGMDTLRVEEIMWYCIEQGLFDQDEVTGRITAAKIYKYLQQSETRSKEIRAMIAAFKGVSQTVRDKCEEQNRIEQNRIVGRPAKKRKATTRHPEFDVPMNETRYTNLCKEYGREVVDANMQEYVDWATSKNRQILEAASATAGWMRRGGVKPKPVVTKVQAAPDLTSCPSCGSEVRVMIDTAACLDKEHCGKVFAWDGEWREQ